MVRYKKSCFYLNCKLHFFPIRNIVWQSFVFYRRRKTNYRFYMVPEARSFFLRENRYLLTMQQVPPERLSLKSESTMTLLFFNQQSFTAFADFVRKFPMHDIIYSSLSCNFPSTFRSMFLLRASILQGVSVIRIFLVFLP